MSTSENDEEVSENCDGCKTEESSSETESSLSKKTGNARNITSQSDCMIDTNIINMNECSDSNLNPLVWQKFQFLISVLKDIQYNIQEMDSLILDRQSEVTFNSRVTEESSSMDHLVNAVESSKTDEAKLNEILTLLHRITRTLSSFEQSPLLAEELQKDFGKDVKLGIDTFLRGCSLQENVTDVSKTRESSSLPKEEEKPSTHRFSKETSSLRTEIEDAIRRKNVLDERLSLLVAQRAQRRLEEELNAEREVDAVDHINRIDDQCPRIQITTTDEAKEEGEIGPEQESECAPNSLLHINKAVINELRNDESEIPGLAESGLSSEINSLSITINNIMEENKQLHAICSNFTEPVISQTVVSRNEKESKGAKPKKKKMRRKMSNTNLENSFFGNQNSEDNSINGCSTPPFSTNDCSTQPFSSPFMKHFFDKKIKELMKEQTDMISQLNQEKRKSNEKSQALEKVVAELIKVNRENRMKYVEEFQAVDVENCKLEDDLLALKRQNQKLLRDLQRLKSMQGHVSREGVMPHGECDTRSCSCSNHGVCLEYFRLLLRGKGLRDEPPKQRSSASPAGLLGSSYHHHISASENNLNKLGPSLSNRTSGFSSLPAIVVRDQESPQDAKRVLHSSSESDCNYQSEMSVLRERIEYIESYFNQQINEERSSKNSGVITSTDDDVIITERNTPDNWGTSHSEGNENSRGNSSAEKELQKFKHKVHLLMSEKEEMAIRIEELMGMMRELSSLFRTTKEELIATKRERNFLLENFRKRCEIDVDEVRVSGESSLKVLDLNQRLQDKCNNLQLELEKVWNEANKNALERDRMGAEKEKLNQFLTTSLADIENENSSLKSALQKMEEMNGRRKISREESEAEETSSLEQNQEVIDLDASDMKKENDGAHLNGRERELKIHQEEVNANWKQSLIWLQRCFVEEKLHSQLLEAAERENSARVAVLEQRVRERGEKYNELLAKYKKLHLILRSRKAEKKADQKNMKEWSSKIHEFNSTNVAIEDSYKVMLSSLGNNIGIAVEILSSHLFLSPSLVHPSPELNADPAFWFAAQCSRLRWLQGQLRKLCVRSWKNNDVTGTDFVRRKLRSKWSVNDVLRGRSLDIENRNITCDDFGTSYSTPASPSRGTKSSGIGGSPSRSDSPESLSSPASESNILTSLNEAELNVTSQQVKLTQTRDSQFSNLVGLLQRNPSVDLNPSSVCSSLVSLSLKNLEESCCSGGSSRDISVTENSDNNKISS